VELTAVAELRAALRRFHAATNEITRRHGLTSQRYDLLAVLHGDPERPRTATALAELLQLSRNATTELVSRAEKSGLVARASDPADARVKRIAPTAEGSRRFLAVVAELRPERRRLLELLEEIAARTAA
jgi:DNA-binding MarR family transcriptional regulator